METDKREGLERIRHSCAHLLAAAVLKLWPDTKITIGPAIEDGFYYDFEFSKPISEEDFGKIEKKMKEILSKWNCFEEIKAAPEKAKEMFRDNKYKIELINELLRAGEKITLYKSGDFVDLCKGGHVKNPKKEIGAFKLMKLAGAYWRGNENNQMLTRIYGVCFSSEKELKEYLEKLEEAKKRDHKILGPKLGMFLFHETSPGMPYWLPKGLLVYNKLIEYWREEHAKEGYKEISSPIIAKKELYEISGHWEHYRHDMFIADMGKNEVYGIKPMNCPNAMIVFKSESRSYKDLPLRFSDIDKLHRYERSGTLNGLLRVRSFQQDDSHNFIGEEMIEEEYKHLIAMCERFYALFGLEYSFRLGTRPEKFVGDIESWDKAEKILKDILKMSKKKYSIFEGDGAFYGPKIDILMQDCLGREWQLGTLQLDFQLPKRFELKYIDKKGNEKIPVVVHRVIYGSLERFIGILLEHFAGAFPVWMHPVQATILPISEKQLDYAEEVAEELKKKCPSIRLNIPVVNETLQKRIRNAQLERIPYIIVVGDKEKEKKTINLRLRTEEAVGEIKIDDFASIVNEKIEKKALDLWKK